LLAIPDCDQSSRTLLERFFTPCIFRGALASLSNWCTDRFGPRGVISDAIERRFDIPWLVLDASRTREQWNWKTTRPILSILAEVADHAEKHPNWLRLTSD